MQREVRWEHMYLDELEEAFANRPAIFLPYGLCEPHGPQNALGCDSLRAHGICCAAARQFGGIVAPVHYWHLHDYGEFSEWAHRAVGQVPRTWLTPMPPWLFFRIICYHLRTADAQGFHAAVLYTGHGGLHDRDVGPFVELIQPHVGARLAFVRDIDDLRNDPNTDMEWADHAGKGETSMLWAVEPSCTDLSRLPPRRQAGPHFAMGENAYDASLRQGEWMIQHKAEHLIKTAQSLLDAYKSEKPKHTLNTYAAVEKLWRDVVSPALPEFWCMKYGDGGVPEDSVWHTNWRIPEGID